jgi:hypothetical protein
MLGVLLDLFDERFKLFCVNDHSLLKMAPLNLIVCVICNDSGIEKAIPVPGRP